MEDRSARTSPVLPPESRFIDFVLALVRAESDMELSDRISSVFTLSEPHCDFPQMFGDVVVITIGGEPNAERKPQQRSKLVDALIERFASDVSVLHGSCEALVGLVGSTERLRYVIHIPRLSVLLERVRDLRPGQVRQLKLD